jgi:hypothetical protein
VSNVTSPFTISVSKTATAFSTAGAEVKASTRVTMLKIASVMGTYKGVFILLVKYYFLTDM